MIVITGTSSGTVAAVVVVCVALLVAVIGVAVARIRSVNNRNGKATNVHVEDGPEMEWDNSTLNITVNPLEGVSGQQLLAEYIHVMMNVYMRTCTIHVGGYICRNS